ncbi:hypothetical protein SAMN05444339_11026 [Loktanella atrilutea]|uniref:Uncharacterized protein n=1 Tax=Loktanella atrilutea TaxID=366533 RepID=A0A1M5DK26_LOKAT|nr:hypothetical protein [Loktanella atrilutea]SHF67254.1 hypothetical protein SAMN05444339_11026 [Loktanella atrilutea]
MADTTIKVMESMVLRVKIKWPQPWLLRRWLGLKFLALAAATLGCGLAVEIDGPERPAPGGL